MGIDQTAFIVPAPRIRVEAGYRALVFEALYWGMPERRGDRPYDPVQCMWGSAGSGQIAIETEQYGFDLEQLDETRRVLQDILDDPVYKLPTREECGKALEIVDFARDLLTATHLDHGY